MDTRSPSRGRSLWWRVTRILFTALALGLVLTLITMMVVAKEREHNIHLQQPSLVVEAVRRVIADSRS